MINFIGENMLKNITVALLSFWFSLPSVAGMTYQTPIHRADWVSDSSRLQCSLTHKVEGFGDAVFKRDAGGELGLFINTEHPPRSPQLALLTSTPSAWGHTQKFRMINDVEFYPEQTALTLDVTTAHRLLLELEQGKVPSFGFMDWQDGKDEIEVRLSNVNFLKAYRQFNMCITSLLGFPYSDVQHSVVYFENDKSELTEGAQHRLKQIATFLHAAPEYISNIQLTGHTDSNNTDEYNIVLSERRVEAVNQFLMKYGIDTSLYKIDWMGEMLPVATNITADGRAQNRRVEIELIKKIVY